MSRPISTLSFVMIAILVSATVIFAWNAQPQDTNQSESANSSESSLPSSPDSETTASQDSAELVQEDFAAEGINAQKHDYELVAIPVDSGGWVMVFQKKPPLIKNDAVIFGILMVILGIVFYSSNSNISILRSFYKLVPMLLLCYFLPSVLTFFRIVDPEESNLYFVASRYLLPASLVLLTLSIDLREIVKLGPKALIMFGTGTIGVILGGPLAVLVVSLFNPELVGGSGIESTWRGLSTVAGSWIGGGANQAAMYEIFLQSDDMTDSESKSADRIYSIMVAVDVIVAEIWMVFLLLGVGKSKQIDKAFNADASSIDRLQEKMEKFSLGSARVSTTTDLMVILAIAFGVTALSHFAGDLIAPFIKENYPFLEYFSLDSQFFWLIVLATLIGIGMSFTRLRNYEGAGASRIGTVFIFILVATIGMRMDIRALAEHPGLFLVGGLWMLFHVGLLFFVGWMIRAPYFFLAVGSKANIGGAASAPVVAAAFHPSLAPVGVLLAVLGYAVGTIGAYLCGLMMQGVSPVN